MLGGSDFSGFLAFVLMVALPLTAVLGVVVRRLYRKAVTRAMMDAAGTEAGVFDVPPAGFPNAAPLEFDVQKGYPKQPLRWGLAGRYLLAGVAGALVLTCVLFALNEIAFLPVRFTVVAASFAFPALIMACYVAGIRWYLIVLIATFVIWLLYVIAPESNDILGMLAMPALLLALAVGNPAQRTTTLPLLLVSISFVVPLTFSLHVIYYALLFEVLDGFFYILPAVVVMVLYVLLSLAALGLLGLGLAFLALRGVARLTARSSELMMQHDVLWLFQVLWLMGMGWTENGLGQLAFFAAFVSYRSVLRATRPRAEARPATLLLRVFGQRRAQTRLARNLVLNQRQDAPVVLIGAEDLATETLDAQELAAYLRRDLQSIFVQHPEDIEKIRIEGRARHADGLFPVLDHYCRDDTWQPTVLTLMSEAGAVIVDMRGFDPVNLGIQYEIEALAQRVPASRITVLAEQAAEKQVQEMFRAAWHTYGRGTDASKMSLVLTDA